MEVEIILWFGKGVVMVPCVDKSEKSVDNVDNFIDLSTFRAPQPQSMFCFQQ